MDSLKSLFGGRETSARQLSVPHHDSNRSVERAPRHQFRLGTSLALVRGEDFAGSDSRLATDNAFTIESPRHEMDASSLLVEATLMHLHTSLERHEVVRVLDAANAEGIGQLLVAIAADPVELDRMV